MLLKLLDGIDGNNGNADDKPPLIINLGYLVVDDDNDSYKDKEQ